MQRVIVTLLVLVVSARAAALAQEPDADQRRQASKAWWRFLEGEWSYEIPAIERRGTAVWQITAEGHALLGRFVDDAGSTAVELSGWRSDQQMEVAAGFGSEGNYWVLEFTNMTPDIIEATNYGILPDGKKYEGKFVGRRVAADHYQWDFRGKTGDGEELTMTGKYVRKKD